MNLKENELDTVEYIYGSKNTNSNIHGFVWTHSDEIVVVTDQGVELIQVIILKLFLFFNFKDFAANFLLLNYFFLGHF